MDHAAVQRWLDGYLEAWRANERGPIEALFTPDVVYRFRPYPAYRAAVGIDAVVDAWLGETRDEPGTWEAEYSPFTVDGERAVATGWSRYAATATEPARTYWNAYLLEFAADGRCRALTEFYVLEEPQASA